MAKSSLSYKEKKAHPSYELDKNAQPANISERAAWEGRDDLNWTSSKI